MLRVAAALALIFGSASSAAAPHQARFDWFDYRGHDGLPKPGADQYANPILQGFYPDPSVVRVGRDYYLVNSTFAWFPGIPVWHSRDLVSWTQIGNAIDRPGQLKLDGLGMGQGVFAPDISWHDGTFYLLNTCIGCGGNYLLTAKNAAGPWSDPVFLPDVDGIDTSLFFDTDGSAWIVHNGPPPGKPEYEGQTAIWLQRLDLKTMKTGPKQLLVNKGTHPERKPIWIEAPHIIRKDGSYYLIAAEGGTAEQHSEVVFRSDRVTGPYVAFAGNPILTQRDLPENRPNSITSTGHASFVDTPAGDWWAVFLGVRPYDAQQNFNTGRETFLAPVTWRDGWPRMLDAGQRLPWVAKRPDLPKDPKPRLPTNGDFTIREDFTSNRLPIDWMMISEPHQQWWHIGGGALSIEARPSALGAGDNPSLVARRQQHLNFVATTKVAFAPQSNAAEAGLVAMQNPEWWYGVLIGRDKGRRVIRLRRHAGSPDPIAGTILASAPLPRNGPIELRVAGHGAAYDFSWSADGWHWHVLASDADGTVLSTKRAGGFVGAVVGVYAHDGAVPKP